MASMVHCRAVFRSEPRQRCSCVTHRPKVQARSVVRSVDLQGACSMRPRALARSVSTECGFAATAQYLGSKASPNTRRPRQERGPKLSGAQILERLRQADRGGRGPGCGRSEGRPKVRSEGGAQGSEGAADRRETLTIGFPARRSAPAEPMLVRSRKASTSGPRVCLGGSLLQAVDHGSRPWPARRLISQRLAHTIGAQGSELSDIPFLWCRLLPRSRFWSSGT